MARKKGGVTLFELLNKDHAPTRWRTTAEPTRPPEPATEAPQQPATPQAPDQPAPAQAGHDDDGQTYVVHVARTHVYIAAGVLATVLLVMLVIVFRAAGPDRAVSPEGEPEQAAGTVDQEFPLASLVPPLENVPPDSPTLMAGRPAPVGGGSQGPLEAAPAGLAPTDTRKPGLNYLVIQNVPASAKEHVPEVRKFLASKGIRTLSVPGVNASVKIVSEQGFNWDDPVARAALEALTQKVRAAGKEYATAKYAGNYNFRDPYPEKFKGTP